MLMHCLMTRILKQMILMLVLSFILPIWAMAAQPLNIQQAEPDRLNSYLKQVIHPQAFRNYQNIQELDRVAAFIKQQVEQFSIPCEYQTYAVDGKTIVMWFVICKWDMPKK